MPPVWTGEAHALTALGDACIEQRILSNSRRLDSRKLSQTREIQSKLWKFRREIRLSRDPYCRLMSHGR